jgi:hypothetical protein
MANVFLEQLRLITYQAPYQATGINPYWMTGNLGINTIPNYTLDVYGDINFQNNIYRQGVLFPSLFTGPTGSEGPALFTLIPTANDILPTSNSILKVLNDGTTDTIETLEGYTNAFLTFKTNLSLNFQEIGLNISGPTLDYSFLFHQTIGSVYATVNGGAQFSLGVYNSNDIYSIVLTNYDVKWYVNGNLGYTWTIPPPVGSYKAQFNINKINDEVTNISYGYIQQGNTGADGPQGSQGTSSGVVYYLNKSITGSVASYSQMSKNAVIGITGYTGGLQLLSSGQTGVLGEFITDVNDPNVLFIPPGIWNSTLFLSAVVGASSAPLLDVQTWVEFYKYTSTGSEILLAQSSKQPITTLSASPYQLGTQFNQTPLSLSDKISVKILGENITQPSKVVNLTAYYEDNTYSNIISSFSIPGITGPQGPTGSNSLWNSSGTNIIYYNSGSVAIGKVTPTATSTLDVQGNIFMTGGSFNMFGSQLQNPIFNAYKETIFITSYSGAFTLNANTGNNFSIFLSSGTNSVIFSNFAPTGTLHGINLFVTAQTGASLSYPSTVSWGTAGQPTLTGNNLTDVLNFITWTGSSKILGFVGGKGF